MIPHFFVFDTTKFVISNTSTHERFSCHWTHVFFWQHRQYGITRTIKI